MKKIISAVLVAVMLISFVSCSSNKQENKKTAQFSVVTTIFPFYDFAKNIVGDKMDVKLLIKPGKSAHDYKNNITIADLSTIHNSDIFVYCGGETDSFIETSDGFTDRNKNHNIRAMDFVDTYDEEVVEGMQEEEHNDDDHSSEEKHKETDEHIWTNPLNVIKICDKITDLAKEIDKENSSYYEENNKKYSDKLKKLDNDFENMVSSAKRNTILVGDRFPFRYLAERYSLKYYAAFPGCSSSVDVSLTTISFLVKKIENEKLPVVFYTDGSTKEVCNQICERTGAKPLLLHSCHDLTQEEFDNGANYISLMENNLKNLSEALN